MQVVVNRPYIRRKERIGKIGMLIGFLAFLVGIGFVFQVTPEADYRVYIGAYGSVITGLVAFNIGSLHYLQWARKPTPLQAITDALKNIHKKSWLFSYLPHLSAEHVLLTPGGVFILIAKHVDGTVSGGGEKWKHIPERRLAAILNPFSQIRLGRPIQEAKDAETSIRQAVVEALGAEQAAEIPIESIVVFTNNLVRVQLEDPAVVAVVPDALHSHIAQRSRGRLTPAQLDKLSQSLKGGFEVAEDEKKRRKVKRTRGSR